MNLKKTLHYALSLVAMTSVACFPVAHAQQTAETSQALDAASYGLLVKLPIKPESRTDFLQIIKERIVTSRQRPEVVDFRVLATSDPHVFVAIESFRNKDAFSVFEKLPESQRFLSVLKPLINGAVEASVLQPLP